MTRSVPLAAHHIILQFHAAWIIGARGAYSVNPSPALSLLRKKERDLNTNPMIILQVLPRCNNMARLKEVRNEYCIVLATIRLALH
jgi:hypothetical protein